MNEDGEPQLSLTMEDLADLSDLNNIDEAWMELEMELEREDAAASAVSLEQVDSDPSSVRQGRASISIPLGDENVEEEDDFEDLDDDELDAEMDLDSRENDAEEGPAKRPSLLDQPPLSPESTTRKGGNPSSSTPSNANTSEPSRGGVSARRADPLQHHNQLREPDTITIAAAYASGNIPAYSKKSARPYVPEKMAVKVPALLSDAHTKPHDFFHTSVPLPLPLTSLLEKAATLTAPRLPESATPTPSTHPLLLETNRKINTFLETTMETIGPLPDSVLEAALLPPKQAWHPSDFDNLDRGLEAVGKNFTKIARDYVGAGKSTFDCIHTYYTRKFELRSVKVRKYKKKVAKEDEEYVKYVAGLGKYIALETKRMKAEQSGKIGGLPGGVSREGNTIRGLMSSVKDITDAASLSNVAAAAAAATAAAAGISADDTGRGVRTRRSAAAARDD
ncbi:hypothetical protein HDU81_006816 [Chytriomyces hyalinus]|nr:hypothetical protein HDU81_006816 [Chytriomyces hyalinus]